MLFFRQKLVSAIHSILLRNQTHPGHRQGEFGPLTNQNAGEISISGSSRVPHPVSVAVQAQPVLAVLYCSAPTEDEALHLAFLVEHCLLLRPAAHDPHTGVVRLYQLCPVIQRSLDIKEARHNMREPFRDLSTSHGSGVGGLPAIVTQQSAPAFRTYHNFSHYHHRCRPIPTLVRTPSTIIYK